MTQCLLNSNPALGLVSLSITACGLVSKLEILEFINN